MLLIKQNPERNNITPAHCSNNYKHQLVIIQIQKISREYYNKPHSLERSRNVYILFLAIKHFRLNLI